MSRPLRALLLAALGAVFPSLAQQPPTDEKLRELLQQRLDANLAVGIVVGIVDERGRRIIAVGTRDREGGGAVDGDTLFEIGSVTKVFTASLLAEMAARGEVKLDEPVTRLLPAGVKLPKVAGHEITLVELATHAAGLPRIPDDLAPADPLNPYAGYGSAKLYRYLGRLPDARGPASPGERYSNTGMGLLGHALSLRAGKGYEALLRERILAPLGMTSTVIALDDTARRRFAPPHSAGLFETIPWDLDVLVGAGGLRSSMNDMLAFAEANLGLRQTPLDAVLPSTHAVQRRDTDQALGWISLYDAVLWHNGATGGSVSYLGIDKPRRRAVVILANSQNSVTDLGHHFMHAAMPLQRVAPQPAPPRAIALADPAAFDAFVGTYRITPDFAIVVTP